ERAAAGLRALGAESAGQQATALRARVALAAGDNDRAFALADECADNDDDLTTAGAVGTVNAGVLARRGATPAAVPGASAASDARAGTDALADHATACAWLAAVPEITGDRAGSRDARRRAHALYDQKGASALAERVAETESNSDTTSTATPIGDVLSNA